jgi:PAS domain S-box-containing protein
MPAARPRREGRASSSLLDDGDPTWLAILDQLPVGLTVLAVAQSGYILQNSAARRILGRPAGPDMPPDAFLRYDGGREAGRPQRPDEFPLSRALRCGVAVEREPVWYRHPDGRTLLLEVNASRVTAGDGHELGVCTFQDVTEEYERRQALKEAAERVQLALDAGAIVGTWVWDLRTGLMTCDELFAESFGVDPERCQVGMRPGAALVAVHAEDQPAVAAAVGDALARGGAYRQEFRVRQSDGGYRWIEASGRVELDERGEPARFPGVLLDITAWKHADEARTLLMREVDHRARNMLAMVQSVVRLTDPADPARYREEVVGRVDAMARAQGSLSHTNWEGADLAAVLRDEISAYAPPRKFTLAGPPVTLPAEQVQPINMIVHELATNSMKYGALSAPDGAIEAAWRRTAGSGLVLTWTEHGGPPVTAPERRGFGSRLIERLARQIGGALQLDWRPAGLRVELAWRA